MKIQLFYEGIEWEGENGKFNTIFVM